MAQLLHLQEDDQKVGRTENSTQSTDRIIKSVGKLLAQSTILEKLDSPDAEELNDEVLDRLQDLASTLSMRQSDSLDQLSGKVALFRALSPELGEAPHSVLPCEALLHSILNDITRASWR